MKNSEAEELKSSLQKIMNMMSFSTIFLIIFPKLNIQGKFQQMKVYHNPEMIVKWIQVEKGKQ